MDTQFARPSDNGTHVRISAPVDRVRGAPIARRPVGGGMGVPLPPARTPAEHELPALRDLISWCQSTGSRAGYFAALYLHTARAVQTGLERGTFANPATLTAVNEAFFERYLLACDGYRRGAPTSSAWTVAFAATGDDSLTVIQHLTLGMNAHINFDLPIAVCDVVSQDELATFHVDYERMNDIFAGLMGAIAADIATVWWPLRFANMLLGREERLAAEAALRFTRDDAWHHVRELSELRGGERARAIEALDARATSLATLVQRPSPLATRALRWIRRSERGSVAQIIDDLLAR